MRNVNKILKCMQLHKRRNSYKIILFSNSLVQSFSAYSTRTTSGTWKTHG